MPRGWALFLWLAAIGCSRTAPPISFFVYPGLAATVHDEAGIRAQFQDIVDHLGRSSSRGSVGIALVHPYTAMTTGEGPDHFEVDAAEFAPYAVEVRVAHEMGIPVMVAMNGGPWASPGGAFNHYWKTVDGGRYLARYSDHKVNASIPDTGSITATTLEPFVVLDPYVSGRAQDALFLTLSSAATEYRSSRLAVLATALAGWQRLDRAFPGTITTFTTDSEVCDFSFRETATHDALPIGYEDAMTDAFCKTRADRDCKKQFDSFHAAYDDPHDRAWYDFRAATHREFVADTVAQIRAAFPKTPIYTHQLGVLDGKLVEDFKKRDYASPQSTAFVPGARPGITAYIYNGRDDDFRKLVIEMSAKAHNDWAMAEFHPGKDWRGSRADLDRFSGEALRFMAHHGVTIIALLAWESTSLDAGIKDSGVDDAIKRYLAE